MFIGILLVGLLSLSGLNCQVTLHGKCPTPKLQRHFDPTEFFDRVYFDLGKIPAFFSNGLKCIQAGYEINKETGIVTVTNSGIETEGANAGEIRTSVGEGFCDKDEPAKCSVRFQPGGEYGNYWVIKVGRIKKSGVNYGLIYSCTQLNSNQYRLFGWILADKKVSNKFYKKLQKRLARSLKLRTPAERALIEKTDQSCSK